MDISVILVNWNAGELLQEAVESAAVDLGSGEALAWEIVVVDNASNDGSADRLPGRYPNLHLIRNQRNLGFARAANQGLSASSGKLVLFLNPDVRVQDRAISRLAGCLNRDSRMGIVGCRLLNVDLTHQRSVENFHSVKGLVLDNLCLFLPSFLADGTSHRARLVPARTGDVDWLHGAFLLCRRSVLEKLGGFDPDYFMYGEDMDLCYRVHRAGYRVVYIDEIAVIHVGNASAAQLFGQTRSLEILRSTLIFFRKHRGVFSTCAFRFLAGGKFAGRALISSMLALYRNREHHAPQAAVLWRMAGLCAGWDPRGKQ